MLLLGSGVPVPGPSVTFVLGLGSVCGLAVELGMIGDRSVPSPVVTLEDGPMGLMGPVLVLSTGTPQE